MLKPGMLVEKADIDAFWVVPDREGHGIVIGKAPTLVMEDGTWYTQTYVLWSTGEMLTIDDRTLQPYGTRRDERSSEKPLHLKMTLTQENP
tara:strand:+ start:457 stop:729 length:273 start_codon:yes stop_codon:yes gene_type:complete